MADTPVTLEELGRQLKVAADANPIDMSSVNNLSDVLVTNLVHDISSTQFNINGYEVTVAFTKEVLRGKGLYHLSILPFDLPKSLVEKIRLVFLPESVALTTLAAGIDGLENQFVRMIEEDT